MTKEYIALLSMIESMKKSVYEIAIKTNDEKIIELYKRFEQLFIETLINFEKNCLN